jgi:hypothetical protein
MAFGLADRTPGAGRFKTQSMFLAIPLATGIKAEKNDQEMSRADKIKSGKFRDNETRHPNHIPTSLER